MNILRFALLFAATACLAACSQLTTSKAEQAELKAAADARADSYLDCVARESEAFIMRSSEAAFILDLVRERCASDRDAYTKAREQWLLTQVMLTEKPLAEDLEALDQQARSRIANLLTETPAGLSGETPPAARSGEINRQPAARPSAGEWNAQQRVYLDCMLDQAGRYAAQSESATVIAEVVANRCRSHLGSDSNNAALLQEGRLRAMGAVLDARVEPRRR